MRNIILFFENFFLTNIPLLVILIRYLLRQRRGLVKWYDRGLQNLWWEFDSLIPCYLKIAVNLDFSGLTAIFVFFATEYFRVFQGVLE